MRKLMAALLICFLTACGGTAAAPDDTTGASPAASAPAASAPAASAPAASAPAASAPAASAPVASAPAASEAASPAGSTSTGGEAPEELVAQVSQVLEQQFNVPAANITVESIEPMEWTDGSLGCPEPDMMYTQAIVSGFLMTVSDGTQSYELHTNEDGSTVVVCENGRPAQP